MKWLKAGDAIHNLTDVAHVAKQDTRIYITRTNGTTTLVYKCETEEDADRVIKKLNKMLKGIEL